MKYCYRPNANKRIYHKYIEGSSTSECLMVVTDASNFLHRYALVDSLPADAALCTNCEKGIKVWHMQVNRDRLKAAYEEKKAVVPMLSDKQIRKKLRKEQRKAEKAKKRASKTKQAVFTIRWEATDAFLDSYEWRELRMHVLKRYDAKCMCCNATRESGVRLHVDHIKPRRLYPELALDFNNLQILCEVCNHGKGNWDETDWRPNEELLPAGAKKHMRSIK